MRIVTWNINSLRLRLGLVRRLVEELQPDVLCLQETKVPDELFPHHAPAEMGLPHSLFRGMKGYNGVAVLSRFPLAEVGRRNWCGRDDCRHLHAAVDAPGGRLDLHNFYVPAGGDVPDPEANAKFRHKLDFVDEATAWFGTAWPSRAVLVGDLNIAPDEHDVWSHRQMRDVVSHTEPEIARMRAWLGTGWCDAMRHFVPAGEKLYTWWSYRNRDWRASNRGRRLDHVWVTPDLLSGLRGLTVAAAARDWSQPSDHVPVCVELDA